MKIMKLEYENNETSNMKINHDYICLDRFLI